MRLKLYCNRFGHFKDALVCSVNCAYRTRCRDFALFYDEHRAEVDALVADYYEARREPREQQPPAAAKEQKKRASPPVVGPRAPRLAEAVDLRELIRLEVKREMAEASYIWIDKDGRAELLGQDEVLRRATRGQKPQTIYRVAQEMELRFQLVPRKRIEKARADREVEAERAAARRAARRAPAKAEPPAAEEVVTAAQTPAPARRARRRTGAKIVTDRS
jgi:septal ring-binding cell division protein DamX